MIEPMTWIDYTVFVLMLICSTSIALYQGVIKSKANTVEEYLYAGRKIPLIPIILSNMASTISSIIIVGVPREAYYYGLEMLFMPFGQIAGFACFYFFYLPVFYELKYISYFEYLERRFNNAVRLLGSAVFTISQIIYALIIMHSTCTAITTVIPIPFYLLVTILCWLCTFYTFLGGLRGVVWSDFIQALFMYGSLATIIVLSIVHLGGLNNAVQIASEGGRLQFFNFDPSCFARFSSWTLWISGFTISLQNICTNPAVVQRCLTLPNYSKMKIIIFSSAAAYFTIFVACTILGLLMYASYHDCDPLLSGQLNNADDLLTYHVLNIGRHVPGLSGLFLAGILSAALSSLSTILNTLSGIIMEDFIKKVIPFTITEEQNSLYLKSVVILVGLLVNGGIFSLSSSGGIMHMSVTMVSLVGGLIVFIFSFGLFIREANTKGVIIGAVSGCLITLWMSLGNMWSVAAGKITYTTKIVSIEGCLANVSDILPVNNSSMTVGSPDDTPVIFAEDVPYLYRISFNLFILIGIIVSFSFGIFTVLCTKSEEVKNENLLIKQIRRTKPPENIAMSTNLRF
ncbi:sodium-coupled monocarboxylate transporter 1-like [Rhodnius prolixus]|uniref:sodium-coupled monocarboxylate transporter 1-like n=1 Tax=Rhodnius prolixus TaxID=13249 RepID=UPI003D18F0FC